MKKLKLIIIFLVLFCVTAGVSGDVFVNGVPAIAVVADATLQASGMATAGFVAVTIGAKRTYSLPEAAIGLTFSFLVDDSDSLLITCQSGDGITDETNVYSTYSSDAGSFTITAFNTSNWAVISRVGTWVPY